MVVFLRMFRNFSYLRYRNKWGLVAEALRTTCSHRSIHLDIKLNIKMYQEYENKYAYDIMTNKGYAVHFNIRARETSLTKEEFDQLIRSNWIDWGPQELFDIFPKIGVYCAENTLCISDKIFDQYIDTLTDNVKNATDQELTCLFYSLKKWPETPSIRTRNYIEVWAALDDECFKRIPRWSMDEMLSYVALFFMLNVTKVSDYSQKCLQKLAFKAKQLTPSQVVQTMFYIGIMRRPPFDMHNLEIRIENCFTEFNIDELGILSMGFFKSKTPIRNMDLVSKIINEVIENSRQIHEVTLAALLKVIRYSIKFTNDDKIYRLLDAIQHETPRLSVMCNTHIALVSTATLTFHEDCLTKIANFINGNISKTRLKDLERLVLTYGMFNYIPKTEECLFSNVIKELQKSERDDEINKHGRSFICCVGYLGLSQFYPIDLIKRVLSPEFLEKTYGKQVYAYGREVLVVNNIAKIFCKELEINLLSDKVINVVSKKHTDYVPREDFLKQYNITEKMFLDVMSIIRESRGGPDYVIGNHILSHHQRGDIIICNDHNDRPLPVHNMFKNKLFGVIYPPPDENKWIVVVIAGRNAMVYNSHLPTGHYQSKVRELNAVGYRAVLVLWNVYTKCKTRKEKSDYINKLIENVTREQCNKGAVAV